MKLLYKPRCRSNLRKYIYSLVDLWNDPDQEVIDGINVNNFKNKLDNFLKRQELI